MVPSQMQLRLKTTENPARQAIRILFLVALSLYFAKKEVLRSLVRVLVKSFSRMISFLHSCATKCLQKGKCFGPCINYLNYNMTILLPLLLIVASAQTYIKITHNIDHEAKCLDGSPPAIYLHQGHPNNILFYLQGGGVCGSNSLSTTMESCYQRSKTEYGSSLLLPQTFIGEGILSTDPTKNIFANWTKVILLYCDGAFHQGMTKDPFSYKDAKLYFRGGVNTRSHFQYIHSRFNLSNAQKVVLSGSSAGGIAALAWSSYLQKLVGNAQFKIIADSAVLLRIDIDELSNIFKIANIDENVPSSDCFDRYGKVSEWRCLTFEGILPFTSTPSLFLQSAYDSFIISQRINLTCLSDGDYGFSLSKCSPTERQMIEDYRSEYLNYIGRILQYRHLIWSIDCSQHSFANLDHFYSSPNLKVPMEIGRTMHEAVSAWMAEDIEVVEIDLDGWPNNLPCAY